MFDSRYWLKYSSTAAVSCWLFACGTQAPLDYQGEVLLELQGNVEIEDNAIEGPLKPALGFMTGRQLQFVDVEVDGEFPADFVLSVFRTPPKASFRRVSELPGEPEIAVGYIAAVPEDHPPTVDYTDGEDEGPLWSSFAGLSRNYAVAFLPDGAPKHSVAAHLLGRAQGLAAGYHLLALGTPSAAQDQQRGECWQEAGALARARFNEATGARNSDPESGDCSDTTCSDAQFAQYRALVDKARAELDCPPDDVTVTPVPSPNAERISVIIDQDVRPLGQ